MGAGGHWFGRLGGGDFLYRQEEVRDTAGDLLVTKKNKTSSRLQSRKMSADGCLGIALMWLSSTCQTKYLGLIFGLNEHLAWK